MYTLALQCFLFTKHIAIFHTANTKYIKRNISFPHSTHTNTIDARNTLSKRYVSSHHDKNTYQGDVVQDDVEILGSLDELVPHQHADLSSLRDELRGVELGHDGLEHLIADGGEDPLVVVLAQPAVQGGELGLLRSVENTKPYVDHLQVLAARGGYEELRTRPDVVDDRILEPRDPGNTHIKMRINKQSMTKSIKSIM